MKKVLLAAVSIFMFTTVFAQQETPAPIRDGSFEKWHQELGTGVPPLPYEDMDSFTTSNFLTTIPQLGSSRQYVNVTKVAGRTSGKFAVQLASVVNATDTVAGTILTASKEDLFSSNFFGGFPYTDFPDSLVGYYKFTKINDEAPVMFVVFSKEGEPIDFINHTFEVAATNFTRFSIPIELSDQPDTCGIIVSTAAPAQAGGGPIYNGTKLVLDDLKFVYEDDGTASITGKQRTTKSNIYPSPAKEVATINYTLSTTSPVAIKVMDIAGKVIEETKVAMQATGNYSLALNTANYAGGLYTYSIITNEGTTTKKFVVQK